jgi:hypothetical protein
MRRIATALGVAGALVAIAAPASASAAFGPVGAFGGSGSGNGQFNGPRGLAASAGTVYVADTSNNRVEYFNTAGTFQGFLSGSPASPTDVAIAPDTSIVGAGPTRVVRWVAGLPLVSFTPPGTSYGVAVDSGGNIYVSDSQNGVIRRYNALGNLQPGTIGSPGTGPGQLLQPQGLAVDSTGLYVADPGNGKIVKYGSAGVQEWTMPVYTVVANGTAITGRIEPHDVAVDGSGRVIVPDAGPHSNLVAVFGADGSLQQLFGSPDSDPGDPCVLRSPLGVSTSPAGKLYVASTGENLVRVFDEASGACPGPDFGPGGGASAAPAGAAPGASNGKAGKPQIKLLGFPHHCARHNFVFQIHVTDDGVIKKLLLFVNGNRAARQKPGQSEWNLKVRIPVQSVRREIPKGSRVKVTIAVKALDDSGKKALLRRTFQICG